MHTGWVEALGRPMSPLKAATTGALHTSCADWCMPSVALRTPKQRLGGGRTTANRRETADKTRRKNTTHTDGAHMQHKLGSVALMIQHSIQSACRQLAAAVT